MPTSSLYVLPPEDDNNRFIAEIELRYKLSELREAQWSPNGEMLAFVCADPVKTKRPGPEVMLWHQSTNEYLFLERLTGEFTLTFDASSRHLVSGGNEPYITISNIDNGEVIRRLSTPERRITGIAYSPNRQYLAATMFDGIVTVWDAVTCTELFSTKLMSDSSGGDVALALSWSPNSSEIAIAGYAISVVDVGTNAVSHILSEYGFYDVAYSPDPSSNVLVGAASDKTIAVWDTTSKKEIRRLEGHLDHIRSLSFTSDGRFLLSAGSEGTLRFWDCKDWSSTNLPVRTKDPIACLHPQKHWVTTSAQTTTRSGSLFVWNVDTSELLQAESTPSITYTSAKVVLVGESGAGKTGLGWRLAHKKFKEHSSTHGQQFWILDQLCQIREDGTQCEAILWDLAGQDDYRLIHALFLDDVDLALILFDPTRSDNPLTGIDFWVSQLRGSSNAKDSSLPIPRIILVAARADRGSPRISNEEIEQFCAQRGIVDYVLTSARSGEGIDHLLSLMHSSIGWSEKTATVTTETFHQIKTIVLKLKESEASEKLIYSIHELERHLKSHFSLECKSDDLITAIGHLVNHGYVAPLISSKGDKRVLLTPELLNNLAASFILEARRNEKGLGSLEEERVLSGGYSFPELNHLDRADQDLLRDSTIELFLRHNICFRETDPLKEKNYLVFPELINLKKPQVDDGIELDDDVAYTVSGAVENAYASLVVLLGYTNTFTRTSQWRDQARYEVGKGLICGFRLEAEHEGALDFVLYFGRNVGESVRNIFQGLFESFIARRSLTVHRYEPVFCHNQHLLNRVVVRELRSKQVDIAHCPICASLINLPDTKTPIRLTIEEATVTRQQSKVAEHRSYLEQAIFRLKAFAKEQQLFPSVFISYAWGNENHTRWAERLAKDLQKAGVDVVFDQWDNLKIGSSVHRFVERISACDFTIVIGTELYKQKYQNIKSDGTIVAIEGDMIGSIMSGTEEDKAKILPVLLDGTMKSSFPEIMRGRAYCDFRDDKVYGQRLLELLFSIYNFSKKDTLATTLINEFLEMEARFKNFRNTEA